MVVLLLNKLAPESWALLLGDVGFGPTCDLASHQGLTSELTLCSLQFCSLGDSPGGIFLIRRLWLLKIGKGIQKHQQSCGIFVTSCRPQGFDKMVLAADFCFGKEASVSRCTFLKNVEREIDHVPKPSQFLLIV
jgi:hypothetical protein